jgi:hypothetical protein
MQHVLTQYEKSAFQQSHSNQPFVSKYSGHIYAISAMTAAVVDYIVDVGVKRMMFKPGTESTAGIAKTCYEMMRDNSIRTLYRGVGIKVCFYCYSNVLRLHIYSISN